MTEQATKIKQRADASSLAFAIADILDGARSGIGLSPFDVVFAPGIVSHLDLLWEMRTFQTRIAERLASFARLIVFDKRGTGMSDRVESAPQLETRLDDVRTVMDEAGCVRAALVGIDDVATMSRLFAAAYPAGRARSPCSPPPRAGCGRPITRGAHRGTGPRAEGQHQSATTSAPARTPSS